MTISSYPQLSAERNRSLSTIVSVEQRLALSGTLSSITLLLKDLHGTPADQHVVTLTDRYFAYLNSSCSSPALLNNRARWLTIYGKRLEHHLQLAVRKTMKNPVNHGASTDTDFTDKLITLSEALALYHQAVRYHDEQCTTDVINIMTALIDLSQGLVPNPHHKSYQELLVLINRLTAGLVNRSTLPQVRDYDSLLVSRLIELQYIISHYKLF